MYKILGISVGHSILQSGVPFPYLHPWCYAMICGKFGDEVIALLATENLKDLLPLNAVTAHLISFLNGLSNCRSSKDIDCLFDCTEGQAYEQVLNSTQRPISTKVTTENLEAL